MVIFIEDMFIVRCLTNGENEIVGEDRGDKNTGTARDLKSPPYSNASGSVTNVEPSDLLARLYSFH